MIILETIKQMIHDLELAERVELVRYINKTYLQEVSASKVCGTDVKKYLKRR